LATSGMKFQQRRIWCHGGQDNDGDSDTGHAFWPSSL